jgi:hypothetical protein
MKLINDVATTNSAQQILQRSCVNAWFPFAKRFLIFCRLQQRVRRLQPSQAQVTQAFAALAPVPAPTFGARRESSHISMSIAVGPTMKSA